MALFFIASMSLIAGCGGGASDPSQTDSTTQRVTLYTSVDDVFAKMVVEQFEQDTGIQVDVLGDTEATKTTGLLTRLQSERDDPRCDVWWSSEPMGTILLARDGVLEKGAMEGTVDADWPAQLHAPDWSWVGTALRSRVIVYAPGRVQSPPTTMAQLAQPEYKGRIGMARPQFGTTRIHMALLASQWGLSGFEQWLEALKANSVRLYDGNATVVRAVAMGEIDIGLTDTDDVWAGQENGWDVELVLETSADHPRWPSAGETLIPNTVAIVKDAPNPDLARQLAQYLVSAKVERLLQESTSRNAPVNPSLRVELGMAELVVDALPDSVAASELVEEAMDACERVLGP
jgi:iron(III) transport system substrate-binding protein